MKTIGKLSFNIILSISVEQFCSSIKCYRKQSRNHPSLALCHLHPGTGGHIHVYLSASTICKMYIMYVMLGVYVYVFKQFLLIYKLLRNTPQKPKCQALAR